MDYQTFDQTDAGWRGVAGRGCELDAATLIDAFHEFHRNALEPLEHRILDFHAGQLYAFEQVDGVAIARFRKSLAPRESTWNVYVRGTIAFLEGDRAALEAARDELVRASDPNMDVLRSLARCFGRSYREAYSRKCGTG
jgi:hypothetical protein